MLWTVVLEKTFESPLVFKEIQPVHPEGDQSWVFIGRTDVEAKTPILWPPHVKSWSFEKTLILGKIEGRRRRDDRWWVSWMASPTQSMDMSLGKLWELVMDRKAGMLWFMGLQRVGHDWATDMNWLQQPNYSVIHIFFQVKMYLSTELKNLHNSPNIEII